MCRSTNTRSCGKATTPRLGIQNKDTNSQTPKELGLVVQGHQRNLDFQNKCTEILKSLHDRKEGLYDGIFC